MMFMSGDDLGFVDTTQDLINALKENDSEFDKVERMELLENTYNTALTELIDRGYLYEFRDNHNNRVHLIRHWFFHNKWVKGLWTNYQTFREQVYLKNNEYLLCNKETLKENKIKENKPNENKENNKSWDDLFEEDSKKDDTTKDENELPFV